MMSTFTAKGMLVEQQQYQQVLLRGKGDGKFADTVNKEISLLPPSENLRMINNENYLFAKQSYDQWSLICLNQKSDRELLNLISSLNKNQEIIQKYKQST